MMLKHQFSGRGSYFDNLARVRGLTIARDMMARRLQAELDFLAMPGVV
jgi:hypothetical protein